MNLGTRDTSTAFHKEYKIYLVKSSHESPFQLSPDLRKSAMFLLLSPLCLLIACSILLTFLCRSFLKFGKRNHFQSLGLFQKLSELLLQVVLAVNKLLPWGTAMHAAQHPLVLWQTCLVKLLPVLLSSPKLLLIFKGNYLAEAKEG